MDRVQKDALKYFWDYAEPNSMLGRERYHEDDIYPDNDKHVITTGGSGFGLATILVGVERGFVQRKEAVKRLSHVWISWLKADRHKGHGHIGSMGKPEKQCLSGKKIMVVTLWETAFLTSGILMVREYFKTEMQKKKNWQQNVMNCGKESNGTGIPKEVRKFILALVTGITNGK